MLSAAAWKNPVKGCEERLGIELTPYVAGATTITFASNKILGRDCAMR